jgi:hypothetical protein
VPIGAFFAVVHHCTLIYRHRRFESHRIVNVGGRPSAYAPLATVWNIVLLSLVTAIIAAGASLEITLLAIDWNWLVEETDGSVSARLIMEPVLALMNCIAVLVLCVVSGRRRTAARKAVMASTDSALTLQGV